MITPTLILSAVFGLMAFLVTKNNAKYLLSGYNTMSEAQRDQVDIGGYLHFFKRFHLFLSVSLLALVWGTGLFNKNFASVVLGVYPLLAYVYFIIKSRAYFSKVKNQKAGTKITVVVLALTLIFVGGLFYAGFKNSTILFDKDSIEITGMYGKKLDRSKILSVTLVPDLPEITMKSNGFSAGNFSKGDFITKDRKTIRLFVNKKESPLLLLDTTEGEIYFSSTEKTSEHVLMEIRLWKDL